MVFFFFLNVTTFVFNLYSPSSLQFILFPSFCTVNCLALWIWMVYWMLYSLLTSLVLRISINLIKLATTTTFAFALCHQSGLTQLKHPSGSSYVSLFTTYQASTRLTSLCEVFWKYTGGDNPSSENFVVQKSSHNTNIKQVSRKRRKKKDLFFPNIIF